VQRPPSSQKKSPHTRPQQLNGQARFTRTRSRCHCRTRHDTLAGRCATALPRVRQLRALSERLRWPSTQFGFGRGAALHSVTELSTASHDEQSVLEALPVLAPLAQSGSVRSRRRGTSCGSSIPGAWRVLTGRCRSSQPTALPSPSGDDGQRHQFRVTSRGGLRRAASEHGQHPDQLAAAVVPRCWRRGPPAPRKGLDPEAAELATLGLLRYDSSNKRIGEWR
jgi:hypothetical protein